MFNLRQINSKLFREAPPAIEGRNKVGLCSTSDRSKGKMVTVTRFLAPALTLLHCCAPGASFEIHPSTYHRPAKRSRYHGDCTNKRTLPLFSGVGVADKYSWNEEQFEIEVKVVAPPGTAAKDVKFKCRSDAVDLRLGDGTVLLDGERKVRGNICVDGTFWSIEGPAEEERTITVTIEKHFLPTSSSGGAQTYDSATQFDWKGVYLNDEDEVSLREYDEPEVLDVREYASKLGVDIDNIDMSSKCPRLCVSLLHTVLTPLLH